VTAQSGLVVEQTFPPNQNTRLFVLVLGLFPAKLKYLNEGVPVERVAKIFPIKILFEE
jgi:hypothetical protein